ncbi:DUF1385 domain-containing protein [Paenibacillus sp. PR3]|uniref:DUF1385 domain-containing protein n=1 Tax=Paenibacillus terricola TaxID=2763503 RepID=A0ABR8MVX1_9BACL|nr:DUF1385 domain-containing protein [Paenibacillus terricola]MBD3918674.1 DUF1385 domain-containing protein [Paenibacillus terricola]
MPQSNSIYGGQAVIEGVMFAGKHVNVTAVRRKNEEIIYYEVPRTTKRWIQPLKKIPLVRGVVGILESSAKGSQHLNFSVEAYAEDELADGKSDAEVTSASIAAKAEQPKKSGLSMTAIFGVAIAGIISFVVGKAVFTLVPALVEQMLFGQSFKNIILHNLIEGLIKIIFLLVYLYAISLTPIVKRLFQYHGAEHKVISAYEAGVELTVKNVQRFTRLHYRCGSSFIVFSVLVGVIVYSFFTWDSLWERIYLRLLLLPVVLGVSYEVLRFTNALRDIPVLRFLGYPGLWLQKLTTKEPNDDQVAVSIASFNRMREIDRQMEQGDKAVAVS